MRLKILPIENRQDQVGASARFHPRPNVRLNAVVDEVEHAGRGIEVEQHRSLAVKSGSRAGAISASPAQGRLENLDCHSSRVYQVVESVDDATSPAPNPWIASVIRLDKPVPVNLAGEFAARGAVLLGRVRRLKFIPLGLVRRRGVTVEGFFIVARRDRVLSIPAIPRAWGHGRVSRGVWSILKARCCA